MADGNPRTRIVTLEVDSFSDPIHGIARDEHGVERPFTGWIGLAGALEHTFAERGGDATDRPPDNEDEVSS